ncbi:MAG TPA: type II toxin-antitoxin system VapC family toxin [Intrasporangium sp.]|uniref:type II toxin-antitoxin system VapC family toxin n=1 Tax=Intrasporangium sp. TaxID=1925024 RepID=UPI002D798BA1|nr:type II toxin-antitoxin system VapC family toxin [Intrasporangium sp.]HET7398153.1 type II toxin-antitoxin system VapC family toxin [Intrasporangium sp.]
MSLTYLDTSALVKLVVAEPESDALASWLDERAHDLLCTSVIGKVELLCAARRRGPQTLAAATTMVAELALVPADAIVLELAATIDPAGLRTLDALHLASAAGLGADLAHLVAYDTALVASAETLGLHPVSPR